MESISPSLTYRNISVLFVQFPERGELVRYVLCGILGSSLSLAKQSQGRF